MANISDMIICSCTGLTDQNVWDAVEHGARTLQDLRDRLGMAANCGGCSLKVLRVLQSLQEHQETVPVAS